MPPAPPRGPLAELTREQAAVVACDKRALEVRAGAGAGKTHALARRIARFGPDPRSQSRLLVVTFTREATASLHRRLALLLGRDHSVHVGSFHSWAARALPREGRAFIEEREARRIVHDALRRRSPSPAFVRALGVSMENRDDVASRVLGLLSFVKNTQSSLHVALRGAFAQLAPWHGMLEDVQETYEQRKGERMDYDDLLVSFRDRLKESRAFRRNESARWDHVFVDEFQDVNAIQAETVHLVTTGARDAPNVTVVGDARQAIYGFRGGAPEHLETFLEPYGRRGKRLALTTNFRSSRALVDAANVVLTDERPMRPRPKAPRGAAPRVLAAEDPAEEAALACDEVERLLAAGAQPQDVVVLTRARYLAHPYSDEVTLRAAEERLVEGDAFATVVDAFLALGRARAPVPGLAPADAARLRERMAAVSGGARDPRARADLLVQAPWSEAATARAARLLRRRVVAAAGALSARPSARDLLALPSLDGLREVAVQTVHGAKGLEWDHVVLVGAREGGLPIEHALQAPAHVQDAMLAEERRLLYVALTRARQSFTATWPRRMGRRACGPCRWLAPFLPEDEVSWLREAAAMPAPA